MKQKRKLLGAALGVFAVILMGAAALAAGGMDDPLITLSFLTDIFTPQVEKQVDEAVAANDAQLRADVDAAISALEQKLEDFEVEEPSTSAFKVVTMSKGQVLTGNVGCEVMLRVGTAACVSEEAPGLIDCTAAGILNNGSSLVKNHLYMVTIETRGVKATAETVKVLVRGPYTIS